MTNNVVVTDQSGKRSTLPTVALVFGIIGFIMAFIPGFSFIAWLPLLTGLILGIVGLASKKNGTAKSIWAMVLSIIGWIIAIIVSISFIVSLSSGQSYEDLATEESSTATSSDASPDLNTFTQVDERTFKLIAKDPSKYLGTGLIMYVKVTQFDGGTGACEFRGEGSWVQQEYWYSDGINSLFPAADTVDDLCPMFDNVVVDDELKLWVTVLDNTHYDNSWGGGTNAPVFKVWQLELLTPIGN